MNKATNTSHKLFSSLIVKWFFSAFLPFLNFAVMGTASGQENQLNVPETVYLLAHEFEYGSTDGDTDEQPVVRVQLDSFYISRFETTVAQYAQFVEDTDRSLPAENSIEQPNFPIVNVTIEDARNYARWLSRKTGEKWRLPNEYEWEMAAGLGVHKRYANDVEPTELCTYANIADESAVEDMPNITSCSDGSQGVAEVGSYAPNNASVYDMHGNVWEWTSNCYRETNGGYKPFSCDAYTVRGGSYMTPAIHVRVTNREQLEKNNRLAQVGFRLVKER